MWRDTHQATEMKAMTKTKNVDIAKIEHSADLADATCSERGHI